MSRKPLIDPTEIPKALEMPVMVVTLYSVLAYPKTVNINVVMEDDYAVYGWPLVNPEESTSVREDRLIRAYLKDNWLPGSAIAPISENDVTLYKAYLDKRDKPTEPPKKRSRLNRILAWLSEKLSP